MIIGTIDWSPILDAARVRAIAESEFGAGSTTLYPETSTRRGYAIEVEPPDSTSFTIRRLPRHGQLTLDGTEPQNERFAAALRAALPTDFVRTVLINDAGSMYVDLVPGITPDQIRSGWRSADEDGFE